MQVHVLARVRAGPASIYIPVKVEDLQVSANARITIRPLVDTLPCLGALSISLTESPFVDLSLRAINSMDLLSVPFVHEAMMLAIKMVTESVRPCLLGLSASRMRARAPLRTFAHRRALHVAATAAQPRAARKLALSGKQASEQALQIVVYPNQIPVPLMENSGLPKPPSGMLEITVQRCANLKSEDVLGKGDPYVKVTTLTMGTHTDKHGKEHEIVAKEAPGHATTVKSGSNPDFNEHFRVRHACPRPPCLRAAYLFRTWQRSRWCGRGGGARPDDARLAQILIPELDGKHKLSFRVYDKDLLGQDDVIGEYDIRLDAKSTSKDTEFLRTGEEVQAQYNLQPKADSLDRKAGKAAGELYVSMEYTKFYNAEGADDDDEDDPGKAMEKLQARPARCVPLISLRAHALHAP